MNRRDFVKMFGISALALPFVKPPGKALKTTGIVRLPTNMGRGEEGQILVTDGEGEITWVHPGPEHRRPKYDVWR